MASVVRDPLWRALGRGFVVATAATLAGCGGGTPPQGTTLTYFRDVKSIVDEKCTQCHYEGGIGPFALKTYEDVLAHKDAIRIQVASKNMPPWSPSKDCTEYVGDRSLSDAQITALTGWADQGAKKGTEGEYRAPAEAQAPKLSRVDLHMKLPVPYTPTKSPDDYRCFIVDWTAQTTKYVTGFRANPGNSAIVHHVIAFLAQPADVAEYQKLDDAEPGPGYTCYGGPGGANRRVGMLGGWAPGSLGSDFPPATGLKVLPGSKVILQVHYNTLVAKPAPDETSVDVKLDDQVDKEAIILPWTNFNLWVRDRKMTIPAGATNQMYRFAFDPTPFFGMIPGLSIAPNKPFTLHSAAHHMHTRGTTGRIQIERADGTDECLLDIKKWDFHWQGAYGFKKSKEFHPGDQLSIECHWDNSAANQPVGPDGKLLEPRELNWGEGTTDEMCIGFFYVTQ
ncbi:MAG: monooxygenase [Myxococcales bacterium]|nr:monooxygenase [Myxococcales bacterium]